MMFHGKLDKVILVVIICAAVLYLIIPFDYMLTEQPHSLAFIPHEDPEATEPLISGIPSLMFNSDYLNFILLMKSEEVEAMLIRWPFSQIPQSVKEATKSFVDSGMKLSLLVAEVDEDLGKLRTLREQFRLDEATELAAETFAILSQAYSELELLEQATETTGAELKVFSAPAESDLRSSYDEVLESIDRIREMLALHEEFLETGITLEEFLETDITLEVQPTTAFVGDDIRFEGVLTSENRPLAGREIDILFNSSLYITVQTDTYGNYQGSLEVPYWYVPELDLQALYYPRGEDIGLYLASLSPVIKLEVLFYEAELEIAVEAYAYPGLETIIAGIFDYGPSPPPDERWVEIYLDDVLITEASSQVSFVQRIMIPPETDTGKHTVTVSSAATGRYSPVVTSALLNITRVTLILDINIPRVAFIPDSVELGGKLDSEIGPPGGALVVMGLGESRVELVSADDGSFDSKIKAGMGFGLIGSEDLVIQVFPQEPWYAPLDTTRTILVVNIMNFGILLAVIVSLGIFLPRKLRRLVSKPGKRLIPVATTVPPEPAPVYSVTWVDSALTDGSSENGEEPRNKIFLWYRSVVRLIQGITKAILRPQQTMREFANENSGVLGPAAKLFVQLTRRVEKLLYSKYMPTEEDAEKSQQLSHDIEEELTSEGV